MNIVLYEPEIPQNTGNIARTCVATSTKLHLIRPLGFSLDDKYLKRAGLDYWDLLDLEIYENFEVFLEKNTNGKMCLITTKGKKTYTEFDFDDNTFLIFGKETSGLPDSIMDIYSENQMRVPMVDNEKARSLNLSNTVAIVLYEGLRQLNFKELI